MAGLNMHDTRVNRNAGGLTRDDAGGPTGSGTPPQWFVHLYANPVIYLIPVVCGLDASVDEMKDLIKAWSDPNLKPFVLVSCGEIPVSSEFASVRQWLVRKLTQNREVLQPRVPLEFYFPKGPPSSVERAIDIIVIERTLYNKLCTEADACQQAGISGPSPQDPLPAALSQQGIFAAIWSRIFERWWKRSYDVEVRGVTLDIGITDIEAEELGIRCDTNGSRLIYVRQAYRALFERLEKHEMVKRLISHPGGVVITGQPGTGKTTFIWFMVLCSLMRNYNFVFYSASRVVCVCDGTLHTDVDLRRLPVPFEKIKWALLDVDNINDDLTPFVNTSLFLVQASSPNPAHYSWLKYKSGVYWGMPLWTSEELKKAATFHKGYKETINALKQLIEKDAGIEVAEANLKLAYQKCIGKLIAANKAYALAKGTPNASLSNPQDIFDLTIDDAIKRFGGVARDVYTAVFTGSSRLIRDMESALQLDARLIFSRMCLFGLQFEYETGLPPAICHSIFMVQPSDEEATELYSVSPKTRWSYAHNDRFIFEFRADWVSERVSVNSSRVDASVLVQVRRVFDGVTGAASMQDWILRKIAAAALSKGVNLGVLRVVRMVVERQKPEKLKQPAASDAPLGKRPGEATASESMKKLRLQEVPSTPEASTSTRRSMVIRDATHLQTQEVVSRPALEQSGLLTPGPSSELSSSTNLPSSASPDSSANATSEAQEAVKGLKFSTPVFLYKNPSDPAEPKGLRIPFAIRDRSVFVVSADRPFTAGQTFGSLQDYIFTPAAPNNPLYDAFLVDYPILWIIRTTLRKDHGGSAAGCPLIENIRSTIQAWGMTELPEHRQQRVAVKYLLVAELPVRKRTWTLPHETGATEKDVYCLHMPKDGEIPGFILPQSSGLLVPRKDQRRRV